MVHIFNAVIFRNWYSPKTKKEAV